MSELSLDTCRASRFINALLFSIFCAEVLPGDLGGRFGEGEVCWGTLSVPLGSREKFIRNIYIRKWVCEQYTTIKRKINRRNTKIGQPKLLMQPSSIKAIH